MTVSPVLGRDRELEALIDRVDRARERGGALVLRGAPGIGKSTLLAAARQRAREGGMQVLETVGVQSEAQLPFAGLHQLVRPVLAEVQGLPVRQREALLAAFGMTAAAAPELFLIALATLHLLGDAASRAPVLLVIDDAQWLDRSSAAVLAFVARRLESDPVVVLAAVLDGFESALVNADLAELRLDALPPAAAAALLDARVPNLTPAVHARVLAEAAGNPLAIVELPTALRASGERAAGVRPESLPLTTRLEQAFAARMSDFPDDTRALLLVAALDESGDVAELTRAASHVCGHEVRDDAFAPALSATLVDIDDRGLRFRHPLVRSAIHQAATSAARRRAHAALADVLVGQPERRVWHRAAALVAPDEGVAAELDAAATRAQRRGGIVVAVAALDRAAQLSEDPARRPGRLLRAAELAFDLGRRDIVLPLLRTAEQLDLGPLDRARMAWIREMADPAIAGDAARVGVFVDRAASAHAAGDTDLALDLLWLAAARCWWTDPGPQARARVVQAAEQIGPLDRDPRLLAVAAYAASVERAPAVLAELSQATWDDVQDGGTLRLLGSAALMLGAFHLSSRYLARAVATLRAQGRLGQLARLLMLQAWGSIYLADWKVAGPAAEESRQLAAETGDLVWAAGARVVAAMLAAVRGEHDASESLSAAAERAILPAGNFFLLALVQMARGLASLGGGRHDEAYGHLRRVFDASDPAYHPVMGGWAIGDLAEAAAHSGHRDEGRALVRRMEAMVARTPSPWLHMAVRYARAVLAEDDEAEPLFADALGPESVRWPVHRARLQLALGAWLRRERRVAESRAPLRTARDTFDALGIRTWGERARQELRATGETSRHRTPGAWDTLSPQELQIAQLAADGLSNKEIGGQLYLSHRTVGSHLYRIFPKLGITARSQLRDALDTVAGGTASRA